MRLVKHILILILVFLAFNSCRTAKPVVQTNTVKTDSTSTKITIQKQLDTVRIAGDTVKIKVPIASLSQTPLIKKSKSGRTSASITRFKNTIEVECFTDKYEQIIETQNKIIETLIKLTEVKQTTTTNTEFKTHWIYKALAFVGVISLIVLVGSFAFKRFLKPI